MNLKKISIFWWEKNQAPKTMELNKDVINIGREISNDLIINSRSVSRKHGMIVRTSSSIHYIDYGNTSGSKINGKKIFENDSTIIKPGDVISLGLVDLTVATN